LYIRSTDKERISLLPYGASLLGFALALLSKEPGLTLPLMLLAHDYSFRRGQLGLNAKRLLPYAVVAAVYLAVRSAVLGGMIPSGPSVAVSSWLPNVFALFARYLGKLLLPIDLNVHHVIPPAESFFDLPVLVGSCVTAAFAAALLHASNASRVVFLGLMFIVVPLLPALYIPGIGGTPFAERYLYLPSLGFVVLLALTIFEIGRRLRYGANAALIAGVLLAALYAPGTIARNRVWQDDFHLWSDAAGRSPDSDIVHNNLGRAYFDMGQMDGAIEHYRVALELNPDHAETHNNLGAALATIGQLERAEGHFRTALKLAPNYSDAHNNIGILYGRRGQADRAVSHFNDALQVRPDFPDARHNLGVAYLQAGRVEPAIEQFREVLRSSPRAVNTHLSLASAYEMMGLAEEARGHRQQARAIAGEAARR
jgi:Flp pilus assembly protein TadD